MHRKLWMPVLIASALFLPLAPALADRAPTAEERAAIEVALKAENFSSWGEIEFDDGKWEVDDAVAADGKKYDLDLDESYKIIKRERDD